MVRMSQEVSASMPRRPSGGERGHQLRVTDQFVAETEHGLGVNLRDALLGDLQDEADLFEGQFAVVVERDDQSFPIGEGIDRVGQAALGLVSLLGTVWVMGGAAWRYFAQRRALARLRTAGS